MKPTRFPIIQLNDVSLASVNEKYISGKFVLTNEYRTFKDLCAWSTRAHVCRVGMEFDPKDKYSIEIDVFCYADIDSFIKPLFDGLSKVIEVDDRNFCELHVTKHPIKRGKSATLNVWISAL